MPQSINNPPTTYLPRAAQSALTAILKTHPLVVVTGARQSGKTRLLAETLKGYNHFTLKDLATRTEAEHDPDAFVRRSPRMVIDEFQRVPALLPALKTAVGQDKQKVHGRFILTGSVSPNYSERLSEVFGDRAANLTMEPLTQRELDGKAAAGHWGILFDQAFSSWKSALANQNSRPRDWHAAVRRGGLPYAALHLDHRNRPEWFEDYVTTFLERDLRELSSIENLTNFRRAMYAFSIQAGNPVNAVTVGSELGLVSRTLRRWLDLLHMSFQLIQLPAFTEQRSVRLRKKPKYYWTDPALALHLSGDAELAGVDLETLVFADLRAWAAINRPRPELMYWRDEDNRGVEFVIEQNSRLLAIAVRATTRPRPDDCRHLSHFVSEYQDRCVGGVLLHCGPETFVAGNGVLVTPWWMLL